MILRELLRVLGSNRQDGRNLTHEEAYRAFATILDGEESEIRIGAFLIALRWKGVTVEELVGFARAARERATVPCVGMEGLVCVCPPHDGHQRVPPLEVAAGLVAAGAGARILIVSDRCVPPRRGLTAANVLEELGAGMTWDPREAEEWVCKARFGALAATGMLPGMLRLRKIRSDIGVRTPLATVEKLLAPASAALVVGSQSGAVLGTAVEVIQGLGHPRGIAIQGLEGGVVPTVRRRTRGIELQGGRQTPLSVEPEDYGLCESRDCELVLYGPPEEERGPADNPELTRSVGETTLAVLAGAGGAARNATLLAAAVMLKAADRCQTIAEGIDAATNALDSGAASEVLERLRALT